MAEVSHLPEHVLDKLVFMKNLRKMWARHPLFDASNTILVDDYRYKSLKNNYENCLAIRSYNPPVDKDYPFYLVDLILPWLQGWIQDQYPTVYTRKNAIFDTEDDVSGYVANYFIQIEGYSYTFDPPDLGDW